MDDKQKTGHCCKEIGNSFNVRGNAKRLRDMKSFEILRPEKNKEKGCRTLDTGKVHKRGIMLGPSLACQPKAPTSECLLPSNNTFL